MALTLVQKVIFYMMKAWKAPLTNIGDASRCSNTGQNIKNGERSSALRFVIHRAAMRHTEAELAGRVALNVLFAIVAETATGAIFVGCSRLLMSPG